MKLNKKLSLEVLVISASLLASLHYYLSSNENMLKIMIGFTFTYIVFLFISRN